MQEETDPKELARIKRLQQHMLERERVKFRGFDKDKELSDVWVAHVWVPNDPEVVAEGQWVFAGFRRKRSRRKPQSMNQFFSKIRRKLGLDKKAPVLLTDLQSAAKMAKDKDQAWRFRPPQFQQRKPKYAHRTPQPLGVTTKRKAKKLAFKLDKKNTKFICIGKNAWDRKPGYLYNGPLESRFRSDAVREAERLFRWHTELLIIPTSELSKPLRNQMHSSKRVKAGVTRLIWPEPVPEFDPLWSKLVKSGKAEALETDQYYDVRKIWFDKDCPWLTLGWLRKAIKSLAPSTGDKQCSTQKDSAISLKAARKGKSASRKRRPAAMRARAA